MKIYKITSYTSLGVILLLAISIVTLPMRFPDSIIFWKPIVIFSAPAIVLVGLLFLKPIMSLKTFRLLLFILAILSTITTIIGWMAFIILAVFLLSLGVLYFAGGENLSKQSGSSNS